MAWKNRITGHFGPRILGGANFVLYTAAVVAIVALANWFVDRHNRRWDLTPDQKYSLSPQTTKLLKELKRDITIFAFDQERPPRGRRDLLDNYSALTRRVTLRYVDPDRQPSLARQFAVRNYGTIIVAAGDRHFEAQSATEEGVTNAIVRVLKGQRTAYFLQGHDERDLESTEGGGYNRLKKQFENENYQVKTQILFRKNEIPPDCSLLVIAGPRNDYLPQEVETIKKYLVNGGRALIMLDPLADPRAQQPTKLAQLLAEWNVRLRNDLAIERGIGLVGAGLGMTVVMKYGTSPITQPLARSATLFPLTRSFEIGKEYKSGVTTDSLCETTPDSYSATDFSPNMQDVTFRAGKDIKGPLTLAVAGTVTSGGENKTEGRFVVVGTSSLAANAYLEFQGNRDLVMNMVNWLAAEEDMISIRPKPPEMQQLRVTAQQMRRVLYLGVLGLPLLIIAAGTTIWWRRRA